ncbi:hypothetical protein [Bradyrhizobium sp.]|uniref:hypothetical protein n=1 Tax=Bradyrhizobium sp. TaxID=376 RepID=UPI0039E68040
MQIHIENYRAIRSADFVLSDITLVGAPNAAGKSAIAQAAAAVLSGVAVPVPGVQKNMAGLLVRIGAAAGFATLQTETGSRRVDWPRALAKTKGEPLDVPQIATGIESLAPPQGAPDTGPLARRRGEILMELLRAYPTQKDLHARLSPEGVSDELIASLWEEIDRQGWDAVHVRAKETGARLKGQWEGVTGERYGTAKADAFTPKEWEPELAGESEESLQARITDARDTLDGMIAVSAVDDAERDRLAAIVESIEQLTKEADEAATALSKATKKRNEAADKISKLSNPQAHAIQECPHCNGALSLRGGQIVEAHALSDDDIKAWEDATKDLRGVTEKEQEARSAAAKCNNRLAEAQVAREQLEKLDAGNASQDQVQKAREELSIAQSRLAAFTSKTRADRLHASVQQNAIIVLALDSTGVRQDVLSDSIGSFLADHVNNLAAVSKWEPIEIAQDMSLSYGGRAWVVLSESERFRVRVLLQVAVARLQQATALVIDAADILDRAGRNGLVGLLHHVEIPALVCMTMPTPEDVPDLKAAGIGSSYWIEQGELRPL